MEEPLDSLSLAEERALSKCMRVDRLERRTGLVFTRYSFGVKVRDLLSGGLLWLSSLSAGKYSNSIFEQLTVA
jgi:hypothetical protein